MTQPVQLTNIPQFYPYKCIRCKGGTGADGRIYFIDLGISFSEEFNPLMDGNIYYCNLCAANLIQDLNTVISKYNQDHAPWDSPDRVASSYQWEKDIDLSGIDRALSGDSDSGSEGNDRSSEGDDPAVESDDSTPEGADVVSEPTVPATSSDDFPRSSISVRDGIGLDFSGS